MQFKRRMPSPLAVLTAALVAAGTGSLVAAPTLAAPSGDSVVINEVYGGGGNSGATYTHDFIELYNPSEQPVSLDGWALHYASAAGGWGTSTALTGTIRARDHFLVQQSAGSGGTTPLPAPDAVGTIALSGSAGRVLLTSTTAKPSTPPAGDFLAASIPGYVDGLGWGAAAAGFEAAPAAGTQNVTSVARSVTGVDSDDNAADFAVAAPSPQASAGGSEPEPTEPQPTEPGTPGGVTAITEIQGTGDASPLVGRTVTTEGVVTGVWAEGGLGGFSIQQPGQLAAASTGLFVYGPDLAAQVTLGQSLLVTGVVGEYYGQTQVTASTVVQRAEALGEVTPIEVEWPQTDAERERLENVLILPTGQLQVADNYGLNRYGEIGLSAGGPLVTPTEAGAPGSAEAIAQHEFNLAHTVLLDDGRSTDYLRVQNGSYINAHLPLPYLTLDNPVTVGAPVTFTRPVVVHYSYETFRFDPQVPVTGDNPEDWPVEFSDVRTAAPEEVGGTLQLATFNVLNYFASLGVDDPTASPYTDREGTPIATSSGLARGAWDAQNLARQQEKIVAAINALDAGIVSLEEIEDSSDFGKDRDEALATLVAALNEAAGTERWAYVPSPTTVPVTGDDVIRTAFIYDPGAVGLDGESVILDDAAFANARAPLAQTFVDLVSEQKLVVIVNHFKSKSGSGGGDNASPDASVTAPSKTGGWNGDRIRQAQALVTFAAERQSAAGTELLFLTGDFNAYLGEDPVRAITEAGFLRLGSTTAQEHSYLYDGNVGSLDHVFASPAAAELVTGADYWTINANEPVALEYSRYNSNATLLYSPDAYRSSDHNPQLIGLQLDATAPEAPQWQAEVVYLAGDEVSHEGRTYRALWYTRGQIPGSSPWGAWAEVGEVVTVVDGVAIRAWTPSAVYTASDVVAHGGNLWRAQWWTRNQEPGSSPWGPWIEAGAY